MRGLAFTRGPKTLDLTCRRGEAMRGLAFTRGTKTPRLRSGRLGVPRRRGEVCPTIRNKNPRRLGEGSKDASIDEPNDFHI